MKDLTLGEYQQAERAFEAERARGGFLVHAVITALVSVALVTINVLIASEFPWSPFPVVGMGIGLAFHYVGIRRIDRILAEKQLKVEAYARRIAA